jgi:hypothetical protein
VIFFRHAPARHGSSFSFGLYFSKEFSLRARVGAVCAQQNVAGCRHFDFTRPDEVREWQLAATTGARHCLEYPERMAPAKRVDDLCATEQTLARLLPILNLRVHPRTAGFGRKRGWIGRRHLSHSLEREF